MVVKPLIFFTREDNIIVAREISIIYLYSGTELGWARAPPKKFKNFRNYGFLHSSPPEIF